MPTLDGIDVSHHQGDIDWAAVASRAPALRFVMARTSHGGHGNNNLRTDRKATINRDGMRLAFPSTPRGYYHFLGTSDPKVQARHFHDVVSDLQPGEFTMLDVEPDTAARVPELSVSHIVETLEAIEAEFGVTPALYIGRFYEGSRDERLYRFPLMLPAYTSEARFKNFASQMGRPVMLWQWGGGNKGEEVAGIAGRVDSNKIVDEDLFRSLLRPGKIRPHQHGLLLELQSGDTGNAVIVLQSLLVEHGVFSDRDTNRDGRFERGTKLGVEQFQQQYGIPATGRVDRTTWLALGFSRRVLRHKHKK